MPGLPDGRFGAVKIRLAERPLAERGAHEDDPGKEETIWIERVSACHGIVRSVLIGDLGVDYGDVVLFDGAPITYHESNGEQVPVFPHLATLVRRGYRRFDFTGVQNKAGEIAELSNKLPGDAILYVHTEQVQMLCRQCADGPHAHDTRHEPERHHIVRGRIAASPSLAPRELLAAIDDALATAPGLRLYVPDLCVEAKTRSARPSRSDAFS